jgi:glycosidase
MTLLAPAVAMTAVIVAATCGTMGCRSEEPPAAAARRDCSAMVWHRPARDGARVSLVASWDGWRSPGVELQRRSDGWYFVSIRPPPGEALYAIIEDGEWLPEQNVGTTGFHDGHEVTWRDFGDCSVPALRIDGVDVSGDTATVRATFLAGTAGAGLDGGSIAVTESSAGGGARRAFTLAGADPTTGKIALSLPLGVGKHRLDVVASDTQGHAAAPATATAWIEPDRRGPWDWRDAVVYQVVVDRFRASDGGALPSPPTPSSRAGGTLLGVKSALVSGELEALGVNTLWLSPLYDNPDGTFPGADGHPYSSYHGYWPIQSRALEPLLGSEADLDALIAEAHGRGIRVLFDVVPNHVHAQHPYWVTHAKDGWFSHPEGGCVCGTASCPWSTHILDCWFTSYLPDFDWTRPDVATQATEDVRWWLDRFDADGIRIDAVPMMPRAATRRIAQAIRSRYAHEGNRPFLLGENFVGADGWGALRYQLGPDGLDSEFDFPLMWALRSAIAQENAPMSAIDVAIRTSLDAWQGSGAVMTAMIGNHDVSRFSSLSAGDAGGDGFDPAPQPTDPIVYAKQEMALALLFTLPEAPVVYYGDELGLAGRADPDTRRPLPGDDALTSGQRAVRDLTRLFGRMRRCSASLRRGTYRPIAADAEHLIFARELPGEDTALVAITRAGAAAFVAPWPEVPRGDFVDVVTGRTLTVSAGDVTLPPGDRAVRLYFPAGSACTR